MPTLTDRSPAGSASPPGTLPAGPRRLAPPLLLAGGVLAVSVALHVRDPHQSGAWGFCPWLLATGTYCPGCGGLRAVNDLTRGDIAGAASSNLWLVTMLPLVAVMWVRSGQQRWRGRLTPMRPRAVNLVAALVVGWMAVFAVLRNLPVGQWLAP